MKHVVILLLAVVFAPGAVAAANQRPEKALLRDVETVRQRMIARWTEGGTRLLGDVREDVKGLRPDGSWPDIEYADRGRSAWKTVKHVYRVKAMATVYRTQGQDLYEDRRLRDASLSALRYWVERDFRNPNWWWNEIGVPMALGPSLLLLGGAVPVGVRERGVKILERARLGRGTGQNLVWLTEMALIRACIRRQPDVVAKALARIAAEARVTTGEGIQPDFSFHQHGPQLYSGGYGFGFSRDVPRIARLAAGTSFAFGREPVEALARYLLDGQQWMVRGSVFDHAAVGREITRRGQGGRTPALAGACDDLIAIGAPRAGELRAFGERLRRGEPSAVDFLEGHRHFWCSDFSVHRRRGYSTSVKMASKRVRGWEIVNSEGLRSHHTADGMQLLYVRGDEYAGIFGVWDWLAIPGTTALQSEATFAGRDSRGATDFAGGVSDGTYGVAAMDLAKNFVRARKAWFFFDREIVCLGSGIRSDAPEPVFTTLNQCLLRGDVAVCDDADKKAPGETWWCCHDRVGYVLRGADRSRVRVSAGPQTGSWHAINRTYPDKPETLDVFRLLIDHGKRPDGASYAYAIVPGSDPGGMRSYRWPVEVIANRPDFQALRHRELGITGAVFYRPGRIEGKAAFRLEVSDPCILLVREEADRVRLAAASPEHREAALEITLSIPLRGEGAAPGADGTTRVTIQLPGGRLAGSSVERVLRRRGGA